MDKKLMVSILLDFYGALLSEKQQEIMDYYYNDDLSLSETADNIGITRQGVHDTVKRTEQTLYEMENKLGLYAKFEQIQNGLQQIEMQAADIKALGSTNSSIAEKADAICALTEKLKQTNVKG